jgi:hypothetical protein
MTTPPIPVDISGQISSVSVSGNSAAIQFLDSAGLPARKLQLWNAEVPGVQDRVLQSMWLSLCRDALANGWTVVASVADLNSSQVISIKVSGK